MSHTKKVGTAGRFGPRYGRKIRFKVKNVEAISKGPQDCPVCGKPKIKRLARGIYECIGCKAQIAGKAYTLK
ncbi:MAG: 50S ribosomal protein L37ae [Candidatus Nanoarchaeia archaeon]|jgi:large subunit ribosomal protein L37Ae